VQDNLGIGLGYGLGIGLGYGLDVLHTSIYFIFSMSVYCLTAHQQYLGHVDVDKIDKHIQYANGKNHEYKLLKVL